MHPNTTCNMLGSATRAGPSSSPRCGGRRRLLGGAVVALGIIAVAVLARRVKLERLRRVDQEGDALSDRHTLLADGRGGREEVLVDACE